MYSMNTIPRKLGFIVAGLAMLYMAFLIRPDGVMMYAVIALAFCGVIQVAVGVLSIIKRQEDYLKVR